MTLGVAQYACGDSRESLPGRADANLYSRQGDDPQLCRGEAGTGRGATPEDTAAPVGLRVKDGRVDRLRVGVLRLIPIMSATSESGRSGSQRRGLLPGERLRALNRRTDRQGLLQCLRHAGLIAATAALVHAAAGGWWLVPALLLHGIALTALFAPLHEGSHRTVFHSRWPNRAIAWTAGLALMLPPTWFRHFHLAHHRHTQDHDLDPELIEPKPTTMVQYLWVATGLPFWRSALANLARLAAGRLDGMDYVPARERDTVVREARIVVTLYAVLAAGALAFSAGTAVLLYWLVPMLLGQPFLRLYLLAEHTGCPETADGLTNTRTTLCSAPVRWLMWNMPYHAEHHLYPSVPFHALPALHRDVREHLGVVAPGYPAAHRSIRSQFVRD